MEADYYRLTNPKDYNETFIKEKVRTDGRSFLESRFVMIDLGSHENANGSSQVAFGNTKVFCGIKAVPSDKRPGSDLLDFISVQVNFPFVNSQNLRTNQTSEQSQVAVHVMQNFIQSSKLLEIEDLTDCNEKLFWSLSCELICLEDDGCFYDACSVALLAALMNIKIPKAMEEEEEEEALGYRLESEEKRGINIRGSPVMTTLCTWNKDLILLDPTKEEEDNGDGLISIIFDGAHNLYNVTKTSGCILEEGVMEKCFREAGKRSKSILHTIRGKM